MRTVPVIQQAWDADKSAGLDWSADKATVARGVRGSAMANADVRTGLSKARFERLGYLGVDIPASPIFPNRHAPPRWEVFKPSTDVSESMADAFMHRPADREGWGFVKSKPAETR